MYNIACGDNVGWFDVDPNTCSECTYLDTSDLKSDGYWCEKTYERVSPCSVACYKFCKAYRRDDNEAKKLRESYNNKNDSACFITTIVCEILNNDDNVIYLKTLRNFRNNVLQKKDEYKKILVNYDLIGPIIAKNLMEDSLKEKFANNIFERAIKPICKLIEMGEEKKAVKL